MCHIINFSYYLYMILYICYIIPFILYILDKEDQHLNKINVDLKKDECVIKSIIQNGRNKCTVGLNKTICQRIDLEKECIESSKSISDDFQKMCCYDDNTNIVLSKKNILIDDRRLGNYVCYINYNLIDYENSKKYYKTTNFFCDIDLTGITLTSLNSNNSMFIFDLRYKYPSTCLYNDNIIIETMYTKENEKLKYLFNMKSNYNSKYYCMNKKYSAYHDNIILCPPCNVGNIKKNNIQYKNKYNNMEQINDTSLFVKNKILSDESFIYNITKDKNKKQFYNLPTSYLNIWRWCNKRQFKSLFHYYDDLTKNRKFHINYDANNNFYEHLIFDSIYKFVDTPNHLFVTYEDSNYIHSFMAPSYGLHMTSSFNETPNYMHPTNL